MGVESTTLTSRWRKPWPEQTVPGQLVYQPSGERIVLGSKLTLDGDGNSIGSFTVHDARTGEVLHRTVDAWVVETVAFGAGTLLTGETIFREVGQVEGNRVRVLALDPVRELHKHNVSFENQDVVFSPDGKLVAVDSTPIRIFDTLTGSQLWEQNRSDVRVAWSPNSQSLAAAGAGDSSVAILDALRGTVQQRLAAPGALSALAYSPDGATLVAGLGNGHICAFDTRNGRLRWTATDTGTSLVSSVAVSADSRWVAALGAGSGAGVVVGSYEIDSGATRFAAVTVDGSQFSTGPVLYSSTLRHIVVQAGAGAHVVDARSGRVYARTSADDVCAALSPDGASLAVGIRTAPFGPHGVVECFDLGVEKVSFTVNAEPVSVVMQKGGGSFVAVSEKNAVNVIASDTGARLARKPALGTVVSADFADFGQAICAGCTDGVMFFSVVGPRSWVDRSVGAVNAVATVGDVGEWIAVAAGRTLRLLRSVDGQVRWTPINHPQIVTRVAASSDGKWVATGCRDRVTRVFDAGTGAERLTSAEPTGAVKALAFRPGTSMLATASDNGSVVVADAAAGAVVGSVSRPLGCTHLAFSATFLAAAWDDNHVTVYDATTGGDPLLVREFEAAGAVSTLAMSEVDGSLVVATGSSTVSVYDPRTAIELARILHPQAVRHAAISTDGALVATAGDDAVMRVWAGSLA